MGLQLVFDPLGCLQNGHLHLTQNLLLIFSANRLVPGLVAKDHTAHHVHGGCRFVSANTAVSESVKVNVQKEVAIRVA
jgi:hypothetical protein